MVTDRAKFSFDFDESHLLMQRTGDSNEVSQMDAVRRGQFLHSSLQKLYEDYEQRRSVKSERIKKNWALYFGTAEALDYLRRRAIRDVGDVSDDWRHRLPTGKAYAMVEYIVAYLVRATFPNESYFSMMPLVPIPGADWREHAQLMQNYLKLKLDEIEFQSLYARYLRQMTVAGTSIISVPWRAEEIEKKVNRRMPDGSIFTEDASFVTNKCRPMVEDVLDFVLDPDEHDPNRANLFRRVFLPKSEILRLVEMGVYELGDEKAIRECRPDTRLNSIYDSYIEVQEFAGISAEIQHATDSLEVFEFWGDITVGEFTLTNVVVSFTREFLLSVKTNPYWAGRPYIIGTYTPVHNSPYGLSAIEPALGLLRGQGIMFNQRLDGGELSLVPMMGLLNGGGLDPAEVFAWPGRVLPLNTKDDLFPIEMSSNFIPLGQSEEQGLEAKINDTCGTVGFVGDSGYRDAERVTAREVEAVRDLGGVRLSEVHRHIEQTSFIPFLTKLYKNCQQFMLTDDVVPVQKTADEIIYGYVGLEELEVDYLIRPRGAAFVADVEKELNDLMLFINTAGGNEMIAQQVNWKEVLTELSRRLLGVDNYERFINEQDPLQQQQSNPLEAAAQEMGGNEAARSMQAATQVDGGLMKAQQVADVTGPATSF